MTKQNDPLTVTEVAEEWRVSRPAIHARIMEGVFPNAFRVGSTWRIPRQDIEDYLERQRQNNRHAGKDAAE